MQTALSLHSVWQLVRAKHIGGAVKKLNTNHVIKKDDLQQFNILVSLYQFYQTIVNLSLAIDSVLQTYFLLFTNFKENFCGIESTSCGLE